MNLNADYHNKHYRQIYFDTNRLIRELFEEAGYPLPNRHYAVEGTEILCSKAGA